MGGDENSRENLPWRTQGDLTISYTIWPFGMPVCNENNFRNNADILPTPPEGRSSALALGTLVLTSVVEKDDSSVLLSANGIKTPASL